MNKEEEMIKIINQYMPKDTKQLNHVFESDAEILDYKGQKLAYNIDEFSSEDMLRDENPYVLGWNMVVGTMSDIWACGAIPKFYAHSLTIHFLWSKEFVTKLSMGIADALRKTGTVFIGGDFSTSKTWRYTGSVIGEFMGAPMLRSQAKAGDQIYISGKIGRGNVEAALKLYSKNKKIRSIARKYKNTFRIRKEEAFLINQYSRCCMDTSDGVYRTLDTISRVSQVGFEIKDIPYEKSGVYLSRLLSLPKELLFLGECGEYELLFTISKEKHDDFIKQSKEMQLSFYRLGEIKEKGTQFMYLKNEKINLKKYHIKARDYTDTTSYLKDMIHFLKKVRG